MSKSHDAPGGKEPDMSKRRSGHRPPQRDPDPPTTGPGMLAPGCGHETRQIIAGRCRRCYGRAWRQARREAREQTPPPNAPRPLSEQRPAAPTQTPEPAPTGAAPTTGPGPMRGNAAMAAEYRRVSEQLVEAVALARQIAETRDYWKKRAEALEAELATEAEAELEFSPSLDDLRAIFEEAAGRLFPWELVEFARLVNDAVARYAPHEAATNGGGR